MREPLNNQSLVNGVGCSIYYAHCIVCPVGNVRHVSRGVHSHLLGEASYCNSGNTYSVRRTMYHSNSIVKRICYVDFISYRVDSNSPRGCSNINCINDCICQSVYHTDRVVSLVGDVDLVCNVVDPNTIWCIPNWNGSYSGI